MAYRCRVLFDFVAEDETSELTVRRGEVVQVSPGDDGVYGMSVDWWCAAPCTAPCTVRCSGHQVCMSS